MAHAPYDVTGLPAEFLARLDYDPYWKDEDRRDVASAMDFEQVADVAVRIAARMPQPLCAVCGPIRSGGLGSVELNLDRFALTIRLLRSQGWHMFNQLPFERHLWRIERLPGKRSLDILDVFYVRLFRSGLIRQLAFMPEWRTSFGTSWEHSLAATLLIPIVYLQDPRVLRPASE
jgi:hypothetical protein